MAWEEVDSRQTIEKPVAEVGAPESCEVEELVNALRTHQVELEMQNEELLRMQCDLEASNRRYRELFEGAPVGFLTCDRFGRIVGANRMAGVILGTTTNDLIAKSLPSFSVEECQDVLHLLFRRLVRRAKVDSCELRLRGGDGTIRDVRVDGRAELDQAEDGFLLHLCLVDVSARKEAELRAQKERERREAVLNRVSRLESLGVLAGGIAHDFNNLLTGILANLSFARCFSSDPEELQSVLLDAEAAANRATSLTAQLLTFAKGGAPQKKTISILDLIKQTATFALRGSNVHHNVELPEDLWPVSADSGQLSLAIQNLIINAAQSMPKGGLVTVRAENLHPKTPEAHGLAAGPCVQIVVQDQGGGIETSDLARIFDPYFTTKDRGSGLGLATAHSVVTSHGGTLEALSEVGIGTRMIIRLPALPGASVDCRPPSEGEDLSGSGRVLLMDDEAMIRDVAALLLSAFGYDVETVEDGNGAVEVFREALESKQPFDVVILDLTIPGGMGGLETLRELRQLQPDVRAVVSSGYSDDPVMADYRKYGFVGAAPKPYAAQALPRAVKEALEGAAIEDASPVV